MLQPNMNMKALPQTSSATPNRNSRPIVILGPTTVGKTEVAFGVARKMNAEVINADKFYLYDALHTVTGQSDTDQYPDVRHHLYGVLQPEQSVWSDSQYATNLKAALPEIRKRGRNVVVEGCSNAFVRSATRALHSSARNPEQTPLLFGLRWKNRNAISFDCKRRVKTMLALGMIKDFERAMNRGWGETYLVRKCFAREPLMAYKRGLLVELQCQQRIAELLERHAWRHYEMLERIPNVNWIEHDRRSPDGTIDRILAHVTAPQHPKL
jgi:tRNA A37 N6-isopentenylltransferase MiaA